ASSTGGDARHMSRPVPSPSMNGIIGLLGTDNFSPSTVILLPSVGTTTPLKLAIGCNPPFKLELDRDSARNTSDSALWNRKLKPQAGSHPGARLLSTIATCNQN